MEKATGEEGRMADLHKALPAVGVGCVKDCAISKDNPHVLQCVVGVLADTTAHAGRVVGHHAANHGTVNGGRVWANLVLDWVAALLEMPLQDLVDLAANQSWLNSDHAAITLHADQPSQDPQLELCYSISL